MSESKPDPGMGDEGVDLAHELNNPLASLLLNVGLLRESATGIESELLREMEVAAKRIASVVRRFEGLRTPDRVRAVSGAKPTGAIPSAPPVVPTPPAGGRTILLVDDEEPVRAIVIRILTRAGHKVIAAQHGADALRLAAAHAGKIDLLVTDMYMPGLRGPEIIERLRPERPGLRVLFMSGYADEDVARSGVTPDSSFLRKPFTVQELSDAVDRALAAVV